jgi:Acetyltransferase (GNAT) domain
MDITTYKTLQKRRASWDRAVNVTPGIDHWSTGSDWAFSTHETWGAGPEVVLHDPELGWAAFGRLTAEGADCLIGLDPVWAYACPFVGPDPWPLVKAAADELARLPGWDVLFVTGLLPQSDMFEAVVGGFGRRHQLYRGPDAVRCVIDLSKGVEPWWNAQSERFRRNLRRARRAAEGRVTFEVCDHWAPNAIIERLVAVEQQSWKGAEGSGIVESSATAGYHRIVSRLAPDRMRACIAVRDGADVGYILGGVRGSIYRGLQLSYVADAADLSIGHLLQDHELHRVAAEGLTKYDLGMEMDYKQRWTSQTESTATIVVRR